MERGPRRQGKKEAQEAGWKYSRPKTDRDSHKNASCGSVLDMDGMMLAVMRAGGNAVLGVKKKGVLSHVRKGEETGCRPTPPVWRGIRKHLLEVRAFGVAMMGMMVILGTVFSRLLLKYVHWVFLYRLKTAA